jgi:hypothetical protein
MRKGWLMYFSDSFRRDRARSEKAAGPGVGLAACIWT